jgi:acetyl esterase/lipase
VIRKQLLLAALAASLWFLPGCSRRPEVKAQAPAEVEQKKSVRVQKRLKPAAPQPKDETAEGPQVPEDVIYVPDVTYCTIGKTQLMLDVAHPKTGDGPFPAIVLIHGGGWCVGDRKSNVPLALKLAQEGYVAVTVSYRLSGEAPFPAAVHDVKCAVRWLRAHAPAYKIDKERIAALGYSSGGHLACMLGATGDIACFEGDGGHADQSSRVQAVVSYYGITDLGCLHDDCVQSDRPGYERAIMKYALEKFLGGSPADVDRAVSMVWGSPAKLIGRYEQASPITHVKGDAAPTLLLHGTADQLVPIDQSGRYAKKLTEAGASVQLVALEKAPHNFTGDHEEKANAATLEFLRTHLRAEAR